MKHLILIAVALVFSGCLQHNAASDITEQQSLELSGVPQEFDLDLPLQRSYTLFQDVTASLFERLEQLEFTIPREDRLICDQLETTVLSLSLRWRDAQDAKMEAEGAGWMKQYELFTARGAFWDKAKDLYERMGECMGYLNEVISPTLDVSFALFSPQSEKGMLIASSQSAVSFFFSGMNWLMDLLGSCDSEAICKLPLDTNGNPMVGAIVQ